MTPSAEPTNAATVDHPAVSEEVLHDGETILLALKPSGWSLLLASRGLLLLCLLAPLLVLATEAIGLSAEALPRELIFLVAGVFAAAAIGLNFFRWLGRLYVLTNLRILRIDGPRADIRYCPLRKLGEIRIVGSRFERSTGVGTLLFEIPDDIPPVDWAYVPRVEDVRAAIEQAASRLR